MSALLLTVTLLNKVFIIIIIIIITGIKKSDLLQNTISSPKASPIAYNSIVSTRLFCLRHA